MIDSIDKKKQKKFKFTWNRLVKYKNFMIPETIEEWHEFDFLKSPSINIKDNECFLKKELIPVLKEFVTEIHHIHKFKNHVSYNTVFNKVMEQMQEYILLKIEGNTKNFNDNFLNILEKIEDECNNYEFFWRVKGISISNQCPIEFKNSCLFLFDKNDAELIKDYVRDKDEEFLKNINHKIKNTLQNNTCISCSYYGDIDFAKDKALKNAQVILNIIRFMFCYLYPEYIYQNEIKISLVSDVLIGKDEFISLNHTNHSVNLHWDSRKSTNQDYLINQEVINEFKENCFWDELVSILNKNKKNELEEGISNAIHWIGEAQNEWNIHKSYINFWTAIEALTYNTPNNEKVTDSIKTCLSTLLINGGYHFLSPNEYWDLRKRIGTLYDKRSKIIHRGEIESLNYNELTDIRKYSTQMVLEVLGLNSLGYTKFKQVRKKATRLHENYVINKNK